MSNEIKFALFVGVPALALIAGAIISVKRYFDNKKEEARKSNLVSEDVVRYCSNDVIATEKVFEMEEAKKALNAQYGCLNAQYGSLNGYLNAQYGSLNTQMNENKPEVSDDIEVDAEKGKNMNTMCKILTENGYIDASLPSRIISQEEFFDNDYDRYEKLDWTYYCLDAIMADENNEVVEDVYKFINEDFFSGVLDPRFAGFLMQCLDHNKHDEKMTVYVRTDVMETDIEISVYPLSYACDAR